MPDRGDVTWTSDGSTITITGVVIGGNTPVTITVPDQGHEPVSLGDVFQGLTPRACQRRQAPRRCR